MNLKQIRPRRVERREAGIKKGGVRLKSSSSFSHYKMYWAGVRVVVRRG